MGSRGPVRDPDSTGHRAKDDVGTVVSLRPESQVVKLPDPPEELLPAVEVIWHEFFKSQVARAVDPQADAGVLRRWILAVDQYERNAAALRSGEIEVMTVGSQGQMVLHPLAKYQSQLDAQIARLEKELGLTPMARARLGLKFTEQALTAAQLNEMLRPPPRSADHDDDIEEAEGWEEAEVVAT